MTVNILGSLMLPPRDGQCIPKAAVSRVMVVDMEGRIRFRQQQLAKLHRDSRRNGGEEVDLTIGPMHFPDAAQEIPHGICEPVELCWLLRTFDTLLKIIVSAQGHRAFGCKDTRYPSRSKRRTNRCSIRRWSRVSK
jgi:hypothetical protein